MSSPLTVRMRLWQTAKRPTLCRKRHEKRKETSTMMSPLYLGGQSTADVRRAQFEKRWAEKKNGARNNHPAPMTKTDSFLLSHVSKREKNIYIRMGKKIIRSRCKGFVAVIAPIIRPIIHESRLGHKNEFLYAPCLYVCFEEKNTYA